MFVDEQLEDGKEYSRQDLIVMICEYRKVGTDRAQQLVRDMAQMMLIEKVPNKKGFWVKMVANLFEDAGEEAPF
jgi:hypothetical protein